MPVTRLWEALTPSATSEQMSTDLLLHDLSIMVYYQSANRLQDALQLPGFLEVTLCVAIAHIHSSCRAGILRKE